MTEISLGSFDFKNVSCNLRGTLNDSRKVIFILSESRCNELVEYALTLIRPVIIIVTATLV